LAQIARMSDDAGLDALWVRDHGSSGGTQSATDAWTTLTLLSTEASRAQLGAALPITGYEPGRLASMAMLLNTTIGGRLEISLSAEPTAELSSYVGALRQAMDDLGPASPLPKLCIEARTIAALEVAARFGDDAVLPASALPGVAALVADLRAVCERTRRDPASIGVALEIPVSLGRTTAEAHARAAGEPIFDLVGRPEDIGLFGTLEQCQERVIELAHAGVTDLRCVIPGSADVHDVIAQLTAIAVGTIDVLMPGTPKSKPPDPPKSWGGRSRPTD
jgi:alkanesulfonate monooxygenase SsuD/methylene tetrahydromethanopterin reductase-like flavin-dependent oxidoreductase (luciferase family)